MQIVYLDQNKWIDLARAAHGRDGAEGLADVLAVIRSARDMRLACFPLSLAHYMETQNHGDAGRRLRLASLMREISAGTTLVDLAKIVRHEIDKALYRRFPEKVKADRVEPLHLLGEGLSHAGNYPIPRLVLSGSGVEKLHPRERRAIESFMNRVSEDSLLSGVMPFSGKQGRRADLSRPALNFKNHLDLVIEKLNPLEPGMRERVLYALSLIDIIDPLMDAFAWHTVTWKEFEALGEAGLRAFVEDMPTRRIDTHLRRQWARNPSLRSKASDLNDWAYLGPAAMYCDIVVTEKQLADLLQRDRFQCRAQVLTDLLALPQALVDMS